MCSMKLPPEPSSSDNYQLWRKDIEVWAKLTETLPAKRGLALQFACRSNKKLHEAVLEIPSAEVECEQGLNNVLKVLDTLHNVDQKDTAIKSYKDFLSLKRKENQTIAEFLLEFEQISNKTKANGNTLSDDLLAYQLLQSANISDTDERIIRASTTELTYKNVQDALKRSFGDSAYTTQTIKPEPVYNTNVTDDSVNNDSEEEVYYGASNKWRNFRQSNVKSKEEQQVYQLSLRQTTKRGKNPLDKNGHITQCNYCCSINHYAGECPDKRRDLSQINSNAFYNITLYEQDEENPDNMRSLIHETFGCAVLDCGAPRTVCGENWLNNFMGTLKDEDFEAIKYAKSSSVFKFGNGKCIKALNTVCIPIAIGDKNVSLTTEVVTEDIPLLFSRRSMKKAKATLNTADDTINMLGEQIKLIITSTGHYAVPISRNRAILEQNANINLLSTIPNMNNEQIALKLHRQFAHPPPERLIKLIEKSNYVNHELNSKIKEISNNCEICRRYQKRSPRPVVGMPMASHFNEVVAMDIKFIKGQPVLHLIDCLTRFSASAVTPNKKPETIISNIFRIWISIFGPPETFLSDNGGEFVNQQFISMGEAYNIRLRTTAAESPWSNGICERYNGIIGEMVEKIMEDTNCSLVIALAWANSAKNTMQTIHGFSPAQLVFGYNPMLPCVQFDKPPALSSESAYADIVEQNLKAQRLARISHVQSESSERIRRALNKNIRTSGDVKYINGDSVYFRKNKDNKWQGPASVVGQDGQLVLVRLQGSWYRVHPCNLQLIPRKEITPDTNTINAGVEVKETQINNKPSKIDKIESDSEDEIVENNLNPEEPIDPQITEQTVDNNQTEQDDPQETSEQAGTNNTSNTIEQESNEETVLDATNFGNVDNDLNPNETQDENDPQEEKVSSPIRTHKEQLKNKLIKGSLIKYRYKDDNDWETGRLHSRSGKAKGKYGNEWNVEVDGTIKVIDFERSIDKIEELEEESTITDEEQENVVTSEDEFHETLITQTFYNQWDQQVLDAKQKELNSWLEKGVYEEVKNEGQKLMGLKWVIKPKIIDDKLGVKARLVCKGCVESETFRKDAPIYTKPAIRLCCTLIASYKWKIESLDVKCAFLQSDHIEREIFVKPPKEIKTNNIWLLKKTPYGLKDASRVWFIKVEKSLIQLGCKSLTIEPSVFIWHKDGGLQGIILVYVDDMLYGGTIEFQEKVMIPFQNMITIGAKHDQAFCYIGLNVVQHEDKSISLDQNHYLSNLRIIDEINSSDKNYQPSEIITEEVRLKMRKVLGKLNWLTTMSRPDIAYQTCYMSTLVNKASQRDIVKLNKVVKYAKSNTLKLVFPTLTISKLQLHVYTDAAFGNLHDGGSQAGYIILITDDNKSALIDWSSHRLSRVAGNTLTAETLALMDGVDAAVSYRHTLMEMLGIPISAIIGYTDCKSLYDNLCTSHIAQEKRLRIELAALREHVNKNELCLKWISTKEQIADSLTKEGVSSELLRKVVQEGLVKW